LSLYVAPDGSQYHLHPEFVEVTHNVLDGSQHIKASLCRPCHTEIRDGKVPKLSIAAGVEFGSAARIGLPSLTLVEEYLIAQGRMLISVIKLVGSQPPTRQSARRGHVITFPHSGPSAAAEHLRAVDARNGGTYPRVDGINDLIFISFIGSRNEWESHLLGGMPGSDNGHFNNM